MSLQIGNYQLSSKLLLAPMAGVTDRPYRDICRQFGAGLTSAEMVTSDLSLLKTRKTQLRLPHLDEAAPRSIQIVGTDPDLMAEAARFNADNGAQIIDINMGCPAKKVCNKAAGSALMQDINLVVKILKNTVAAVAIPVTLKIRTGWAENQRNAMQIAQIAENTGIAALAVHGRTRNQGYSGHAEYETIRQIKQAVSIPVLANGDVRNAQDAKFILDYTGVDGLMLGRISHGQPWIFKELHEILSQNNSYKALSLQEKRNTTLNHIDAIHRYYGTDQGVRIARKHIGWYLSNLIRSSSRKQSLLKSVTRELYKLDCSKAQLEQLDSQLQQLASINELDKDGFNQVIH